MYICDAEYDCSPEDSWQTISTFDNRESFVEAKFQYKKIVGISKVFGNSLSESMEKSIFNTIEHIFRKGSGTWSSERYSTFTSENWQNVSEKCPAKTKCEIQQMVGTCGQYKIRADRLRMVKTGLADVIPTRYVYWKLEDLDDGGSIWASDCSFNSSDIRRLDMSHGRIECLTACKMEPNCTHYMWTNLYNSGRCFLKLGSVEPGDASQYSEIGVISICGIKSIKIEIK